MTSEEDVGQSINLSVSQPEMSVETKTPVDDGWLCVCLHVCVPLCVRTW